MATDRTTAPAKREWYRDLAELACAAGVAIDIAKAAEEVGLLREEQGGYRPKLVSWLRKLAVLTESGYSWPDIQAWVERRWNLGHEDERQWPRRS